MRTILSRALCALLAALLLPLCACAQSEAPAPEPTPTPLPRPETGGVWQGYVDVGDELMRALGVDLDPWLSGPLQGELRLIIDAQGRCVLYVDYASCAPALRSALCAYVIRLQQEEDGEALSGLALAEALGADPNALAAALCDELLPPVTSRSGRYYAGYDQIYWEDGSVSPLLTEAAGLRLTLPDLGEAALLPQG